jgi:hypothetical protein
MRNILFLFIFVFLFITCSKRQEMNKVVESENKEKITDQDFSRTIELESDRMFGSDIIKLQTQLKNYGFDEIGEIDGYYGPLSEKIIKTIQYFSGFEQNGKVDRLLWDYIFNNSNRIILENINLISKYNVDNFIKKQEKRMGYSTEGGNIDEYYLKDEIKMIKLHLIGETFQVEYYFYYIDSDNYFIVQKYYRYPFPIYYLSLDPNKLDADELERYADELEVIANNEFWTKTVIEYEAYLKNNEDLYQLKNGNLSKTDFDLDNLLTIIKDKKANWQ